MKKYLIIATLLLTLCTSVLAFPPKPENYPDAAVIAAAGLTKETAQLGNDKLWTVSMMHVEYPGTNNAWTFIVSKIPAVSAQDAYLKAIASLGSMTYEQGPIKIEEILKWAVVYHSKEQYTGMAITPAML